MQHSFDIRLAKALGVNEAIIINNFHFWIEKNRANGKHFYNGHTWTYNSAKAMSELFPYFNERQIKYVLKKLSESNILLKGNYNQSPWDKTCWYALNYDNPLISFLKPKIEQDCPVHLPNSFSRLDKIVLCHTDINTDINLFSPIDPPKGGEPDKKNIWVEKIKEWGYDDDRDLEENFIVMKKGLKLKDSWCPTSEMYGWAEQELGLNHDRCKAIAIRFRDYFISPDAKLPVKKDWMTTWKNWVRKESRA